MMHTKQIIGAKAPLLGAEQTQHFLNEMEVLFRKFDFNGIVELIKSYSFKTIDPKELASFIDRAAIEHAAWYENPLELQIDSIEAFESKCVACFFGKMVKAYRAQFKKMKEESLPGRFIYSRSLAINFELKNNELVDFGWCNAFLEKNEMDVLKNE